MADGTTAPAVVMIRASPGRHWGVRRQPTLTDIDQRRPLIPAGQRADDGTEQVYDGRVGLLSWVRIRWLIF